MAPRTLFVEEEVPYRGPELASHFAYRRFGLLGDSCVAFLGPCEVKADALVDLADRRAGDHIFSKLMLHFIIEHFDLDLEKAVLRQRLFAAIVERELRARGAAGLVRGGDDLWDGDAKLSVSIATLSGVSSLIHFGLNVVSEGTPVKTKGLQDFGIEPRAFAAAVLDAYRAEQEGIDEARRKVRAVT